MHDCYILTWHHGTNPSCQWYIRGINPDRSFYGEIRLECKSEHVEPRGIIINVEGQLSESDYLRLAGSIAEMQKHAVSEEDSKGCEGTIACGSVTHPTILYRYHPEYNNSSLAAVAFLQVIKILSPYLCNYESSLMQNWRKPFDANP